MTVQRAVEKRDTLISLLENRQDQTCYHTGGGERAFNNMVKWTKIRIDVLQGDVSKREILRRGGVPYHTLNRY